MTEKSSWFPISYAAKYLGVHFTTLRRWSDEGLIEFVRTPGGKRKYHKSTLDDFINQHTTKTKESMELATLQEAAILKTPECIQTFLLFRQPMLNSMHETGSLQSSNDAVNQRIFEKMNHFLDEVLVTMVDEYNNIPT